MLKQDTEFKVYDYPIGGKMVVGKAVFDETYLRMLEDGDDAAKQQIKRSLIHQMAEYMLENNLVEFTQTQAMNPNSFMQETIIRVRAFVTPNDQVKILRSVNKIE